MPTGRSQWGHQIFLLLCEEEFHAHTHLCLVGSLMHRDLTLQNMKKHTIEFYSLGSFFSLVFIFNGLFLEQLEADTEFHHVFGHRGPSLVHEHPQCLCFTQS